MLATLDQYTWISKYIFPGGALPSLRRDRGDRAATHTALRVDEPSTRSAPTTPAPCDCWRRAVRRARRRGRRARLRRDLPAHVGLLPRVLRGRVRHRIPRRRPDRARAGRRAEWLARRSPSARGQPSGGCVGDDLPVAGAGVGRQRGRAGRRARRSCCATGEPCAACSGAPTSSGWPAPTSPATSTSTATSPTASAGCGRSPRARGRGVAASAARPGDGASAPPRASASSGLPPTPPASEARIHGRLHSRDRDRAVIAHHYDLSNDFYALLLDELDGVLVARTGHRTRPGDVPRRRAARQARAGVREARARGRDAPARRRVRLGLAEHPRRARTTACASPAITLSREQLDFARKRAADLGVADLVDFRLQDYRDLRTTARTTRRRRSRWASTSATSSTRRSSADRAPRARARGAVPRAADVARARATRPAAGRSSRRTSPPTCTCARWARPSACSRPVASRCATCRRCASTTCAPARRGAATSSARWDEVVALVGEEVARVWRLYLVGGGARVRGAAHGRRPDPRRASPT